MMSNAHSISGSDAKWVARTSENWFPLMPLLTSALRRRYRESSASPMVSE